jgi:hypothetical protein
MAVLMIPNLGAPLSRPEIAAEAAGLTAAMTDTVQ